MVLLYCGCGGSTGSLKKENLRDNMTNTELALNLLAEVSATEISRSRQPEGFSQTKEVTIAGGKIAGDARKAP